MEKSKKPLYKKWWFWIIIIFVIIGIGASASNEGTGNTTSTSSSTESTSSSVVTKDNYDKLKKGMTKSEVKNILGEPSSISENETPGVGTMELNHYQEAFSLKAIDVYYLDGKVYMKNWTEL